VNINVSASAKQLQGVFGKVTPFEDAQQYQSFPAYSTGQFIVRGKLLPLWTVHGNAGNTSVT